MIELFHATNDADSAAARKRVVDRALVEKIRFRNVFYDEVKADFAARGGTTLPALWDGERLHQGLDAVLLALSAIAE
ncbi:MAG TPA: hypothetical protein VFF06_23130 [Polyangia bacterium]|nr:hypothetical protein [Polyangia bacterium]